MAATTSAFTSLAAVAGPLAIGALIISQLLKKGGGPKQDGVSGAINSGIGIGGTTPALNAVAAAAVGGLQKQFDALAASLGTLTGQVKFGLGISTDPAGKAPTFLDVTATKGSETIFTSLKRDIGRSQEELQAALVQGTSQALVGALQSLGDQVPDVVRGLLNSGGDAQSIINAITATATSVQTFGQAVQQLPFESLKGLTFDLTAAMIAAGGGLQQLTQNLSGYLQNFYSDAERRQITAQNIAKQLQGAGLGYQASDILATSRAQFRALVDSIDTTTEGGARMYATFLNVQDAFASITPAAQAASAAVSDVSQVMATLLKDRGGLQVELLQAQGNDPGAKALQRALDTEGFSAAEAAAYDYNKSLREQIDLLKAASAAADARAASEKAAADARTAAEKSFYENYTSPQQRKQNIAQGIADQVNAALGLSATADQILALTRADVAGFAQQALAMGDAGKPIIDLLLLVGDAFAGISSPIADTGTAVDQLASHLASLQAQTANLQVALLRAQGNDAGANSAQRTIDTTGFTQAEVAVYDYNQALQAQIDALNAARQAEQQLTQQRTALEVQILQLQGNTTELRARELASLDATLRPLQEHIYALQDEAAAAQEAARIAGQRDTLETRLLQLQGNTVALRERELAALDPANRAIQLQIYALEDQATAAQQAAQQQQDAAQKAAQIAQERLGLQQQIFQLEGNTVALRAAELAKLDPSNRALQKHIYALQDEAAAAQKAAAIAQERTGLLKTLYGLQGDTAALRALELAALDPANRALQVQIYALQDQQTAAQAAAQAADQLKSAWQGLTDGILGEVKRLRDVVAGSGPDALARRRAQFTILNAQARAGSQDAARELPGVSQALDDLERMNAATSFEFRRAQGIRAGALEVTAGALSGQYGLTPVTSPQLQTIIAQQQQQGEVQQAQGESIAGMLLVVKKLLVQWDDEGLPLERTP